MPLIKYLKDMYLRSYIKNSIDKNGKIIVLIIKAIFKLLIDGKGRTKLLAILKSIAQAFKIF